jgi:hypothetical protein
MENDQQLSLYNDYLQMKKNYYQNKLKKIQKRYDRIETIFFYPQFIVINGFQNLRTTPGQHWKNKIHTLFFDANLPQFWILDTLNMEKNSENTASVTVYLISYQVKQFVIHVLNYFLLKQHNNCVYLAY